MAAEAYDDGAGDAGPQDLWAEVLGLAIHDLASPDERLRAAAWAWLFAEEELPDLEEVCCMAGVEPAWLRRLAVRAMRAPSAAQGVTPPVTPPRKRGQPRSANPL